MNLRQIQRVFSSDYRYKVYYFDIKFLQMLIRLIMKLLLIITFNELRKSKRFVATRAKKKNLELLTYKIFN